VPRTFKSDAYHMTLAVPLCDPIMPVASTMAVAQVYERFVADPTLDLLAVVENDRPVGLIRRGQLAWALLQGCDRQAAAQTIAVQNPVIITADVGLDEVCERLRTTDADTGGVILVDAAGHYSGILSTAVLLLAMQASAEPEQEAQKPRSALSSTIPSSSARDREWFISAVARQIDGPLEGIISLSERLTRHPLNRDGRAQVDTIIETGRGILQLVRDAAELGRIDAGVIVLAPESVVLSDLMAEMEQTWGKRAEATGLTLMVSYEGSQDLSVLVDATLVRRLFNTLIGRALAVTQRGMVEASLKAIVGETGVYLEARIRDGGLNLAPARLARIFEPVTDRMGGSFLESVGLVLCNRIIGVMRGNVRAESNAGAGTTISFDILVPELKNSPALGLGGGAENRDDDQIRAHVLVVDDNATNRMVAEALCEMFGCTSEAAEDGVEAVEFAATGRFDVALMDIKMPRMDGVEATLAIRALQGPAQNLPIIALTANADPEDVRHYLSIGMCDVVDKPIKSAILRDAIRTALAAKAAPAQAGSSAVA
jgi:two-component system, sensor histidine kinase